MALPIPEPELEPAPRTAGHGAAWLGYLALVVVFTFPLVLRLGSHIAGAGDCEIFVWELWWFHHALFTLHTNPLVTNLLFFPVRNVPLIWSTPYNNFLGILLDGLFGPVLTYNLLVSSGVLLAAYGAYRLALRVVGRRDAAFLAGVIYAFAPAHMSHVVAHLGLGAVQWAPFCVWALLELYEQPNWRRAGVFFTTFVLAASVDVYEASYFLSALALSFGGWALLTDRARFCRRAFLWPVGVATVAALAVLLPMYWPSLVHASGAASSLTEMKSVERFGQDLFQLVAPPPTNRLLGGVSRMLEARVTDWDTWGYIGWSVLALAAIALRRARVAYRGLFAALAGVATVLALGPHLHVLGPTPIPLPYWFATKLPLLRDLRCPGRYMQVAALGFAVLASAGAAWCFERWPKRARAIFVALLAIVGTEYLTYAPFPTTSAAVPAYYDRLAHDTTAGAILELPNGDPSWGGPTYTWMYYQTHHGHPLVIAHTHRIPDGALHFVNHTPVVHALYHLLYTGGRLTLTPEQEANASDVLARAGITHVIVHRVPGMLENGGYERLEEELTRMFGPPIYQDASMAVHRTHARMR